MSRLGRPLLSWQLGCSVPAGRGVDEDPSGGCEASAVPGPHMCRRNPWVTQALAPTHENTWPAVWPGTRVGIPGSVSHAWRGFT